MLTIGIDTGNRMMKTRNFTFISGVAEVDMNAPADQNELVVHDRAGNLRKYLLRTERNGYLNDKTVNDDYYILSLFAIGAELEHRNIYPNGNPLPINLAVGLPPRDFVRLKQRFSSYFSRGVINFRYHGRNYCIKINCVDVFPQGAAAAFSLQNPSELKQYDDAFIVDIGGYTTDVIHLRNGMVDTATTYSLDEGMIVLFNSAQQRIQAMTGRKPTEAQMDSMLAKQVELNNAVPMLAALNEEAVTFTERVLRRLAEQDVDLVLNKGIFIGGGSIRLRRFIENSNLVNQPIFIQEIRANAIGYENASIGIRAKRN